MKAVRVPLQVCLFERMYSCLYVVVDWLKNKDLPCC